MLYFFRGDNLDDIFSELLIKFILILQWHYNYFFRILLGIFGSGFLGVILTLLTHFRSEKKADERQAESEEEKTKRQREYQKFVEKQEIERTEREKERIQEVAEKEKELIDYKEKIKPITDNEAYVKTQLLQDLLEIIETAVAWTNNPVPQETEEKTNEVREEKINALREKLVKSKGYLIKNYNEIYELSWALESRLRKFSMDFYLLQKQDVTKFSFEQLKRKNERISDSKKNNEEFKEELVQKISEKMSE